MTSLGQRLPSKTLSWKRSAAGKVSLTCSLIRKVYDQHLQTNPQELGGVYDEDDEREDEEPIIVE